jgi:hypothetical protein
VNLNQAPTINQLKVIFESCNDKSAHHILWVDQVGEVRVTPLPDDINPSGFEDRFPTSVLRYETFQCGNGYVGQKAAADDGFMQRLFNSLMEEWKSLGGRLTQRYIDVY